MIFSTSSDHLAEFGLICCATFQAGPDLLRNKSSQAWFVAQQIRPRLISCTTFQAWPDMLRNKSGLAWFVAQRIRPGLICCATNQAKLSQMVGAAGKNRVFKHFLPDFCPVWCVSSICIHMFRIFWKEIGPSLRFLAVGTTDTKVRRSTEFTNANSYNV